MRASVIVLACCVESAVLVAQSVPPTLRVPPASANAARAVSFTDITAASGLSTFNHVSGSPEKNYIIEVSGSGVGLFDYNGDGRLDIYLINGSTLDHVRAGRSAPRAALFKNEGGTRFTDVTAEAGVSNGEWGQGTCVGDLDNDGDPDLYVTNFGPNRLFRNDGGKFTDTAPEAGVAVDGWSTGCAFGDYDGDGWLDLFVAGYITLDLQKLPPPAVEQASSGAPPASVISAALQAGSEHDGESGRLGMGATYSASAPFCTYRGVRVMCGPLGLRGAPDHLFHNNRDGTFTDVSRAAGVDDAKGLFGFGVAWVDLDDDGLLDLVVANDSGPNYVYRNTGTGRFDDVSYISGAALDGNGRDQAHMGVAIADYDHDGRDDIHITNFADDFNVLYHNDGRMIFSDVSYRTGLAQPTIPFLGWGTDFLDYDNDTWLDLFVANGHVYPAADSAPWNTSYRQRALLFRNLAGRRFEEIGAAAGPALTTPHVGRGSAVGDLDDDGGVDIVINNIDGMPTVARNESAGGRGHWLRLRLIGDPAKKCPRDAVGSVVFVRTGGVRQRVEVASGRGQMSQSDLRPHVGLGTATKVDGIEVRWAGGAKATYQIDRVDTQVTIEQATGKVSYQ